MTNPQPGPRRCIWCGQEKQFHPKKAKSEFNREHVLLDCFGRFDSTNLTLLESVCRDCNQHFGDTVDQNFARDGIEHYDRFKHGHKDSSKLDKFTHNKNLAARTFNPSDPAWHGVAVTLSEEGGSVVDDYVPQVGFEKPDGTYLVKTEMELDRISHIREWDVPVPCKITFYSAPPDVVQRLAQKLRDRKCGLDELIEDPTLPPTNPVLGMVTVDREKQRGHVKMAISYLAKVCEGIYPGFLFNDNLTKAKEFAFSGVDPGYGMVDTCDAISVVDKETGSPLGLGHTMTIGFYNHLGRNQLVYQVRFYGRQPMVIHLCPDFRGIVIPLKRADFWDLSTGQRREILYLNRYANVVA
jgi:hypothetical protein